MNPFVLPVKRKAFGGNLEHLKRFEILAVGQNALFFSNTVNSDLMEASSILNKIFQIRKVVLNRDRFVNGLNSSVFYVPNPQQF